MSNNLLVSIVTFGGSWFVPYDIFDHDNLCGSKTNNIKRFPEFSYRDQTIRGFSSHRIIVW
jgi:muconolactone delta-isomerase